MYDLRVEPCNGTEPCVPILIPIMSSNMAFIGGVGLFFVVFQVWNRLPWCVNCIQLANLVLSCFLGDNNAKRTMRAMTGEGEEDAEDLN